MPSRKLLATFAAASLGLSSATSLNSFMKVPVQTLNEDTLQIPFNSSLACGACIRGGYTYCRTKSPGKKGRDPGDICCDKNDILCMFE